MAHQTKEETHQYVAAPEDCNSDVEDEDDYEEEDQDVPVATMVLPSHVLASLQRQSSLRARRDREDQAKRRKHCQPEHAHQQTIFRRLMPCIHKSRTFEDIPDENSSEDDSR